MDWGGGKPDSFEVEHPVFWFKLFIAANYAFALWCTVDLAAGLIAHLSSS